jgi:hypothetical protein
VSFSIFGERGLIDILAFHQPTGMLLIIELKTELMLDPCTVRRSAFSPSAFEHPRNAPIPPAPP